MVLKGELNGVRAGSGARAPGDPDDPRNVAQVLAFRAAEPARQGAWEALKLA